MKTQLDHVAFLIVQSALARAPKHDTDSTGTDYLLRQILDGPLEIWDEVKPVKNALAGAKQGAKAVGYLMAMAATGDDPAHWKTSERVVEPSADSPASAELREAAWRAAAEGRPLVGWTDKFVAMIERALARATARGDAVADIRDLTFALVAGAENRATEALRHADADVDGAAERIDALSDVSEGIRMPSFDALDQCGVLSGQAKKRGLFSRRSGSGNVTIGAVVATEAVRQAVRMGSETVDVEHVAAALTSIQAQVEQAGRSWIDMPETVREASPTRRTATLLPAAWPNAEQEIPRRIAALSSFVDIRDLLS